MTMRVTYVLMVTLLFPVVGSGADHIADFVERTKSNTKRTIPDFEREIVRSYNRQKWLYDTKSPNDTKAVTEVKELGEKIKAYQRTVQKMKNGTFFIAAPLPNPITVGSIGKFRYNLKMRQIIAKDQALVDYGDSTFLLRGIDFSKFADDTQITYDDLLHVSGTHRYTTVIGGTNTVYVIEPLPKNIESEANARLTKLMETAKAKQAEIEALQPRIWGIGRAKIKAKFVSLDKGVVTLERADNGVVIRTPLQRLGTNDQAYVQEVTQ